MIASRSTLLLQAVAAVVVAYGIASTANAFTTMVHFHHQSRRMATTPTKQTTELYYNRDDSDSKEVFDLETLRDRIGQMRLKILEDDLVRPPNAKLAPKEFVNALLEGIFHNEDPRPDAGFMLLLTCSTDDWAAKVLQSIGAPQDADLDTVASALGTAIGRPHNQYAILVGGAGEDGEEDLALVDEKTGERNFYVHFPGDTLDFLDGTAWVNVEFRSKADNSLLVLTGWQLVQRPDGAWLVDQIDWQDYREEYRPGIGREDWMPFEGRKR